jgi:multidrug efflux system membrane fusion protein
VVGLRLVDPGNIVHASDTTGLIVITQIHPIAIIFTLPEDQLPQVQEAMKGGKKLAVEAYDRTDAHKIASGTLLTIDNEIDTTTGTAKLKAVFDNSDGSLFANQFVNVRLILRQRPNSIVVPTAAIETGNQGDYVFVVNPGPTPADKLKNIPGATPTNATKPAAQEASSGKSKNGKPRAKYHADVVLVKVDFTIDTNSVLESGPLKPGQQVVVDGQEKLVDGGNVSPQQAHTPPATSSSSTIGATTSSASSAQPPANTGTAKSSNGGQQPGSPVPASGGSH